MAAPDACATCPLNPSVNSEERDDDEERPSNFFTYIMELSNIIAAEIPLGNYRLSRLDRRALLVAKYEQQRATKEQFKK
jgi:hypothetical protein